MFRFYDNIIFGSLMVVLLYLVHHINVNLGQRDIHNEVLKTAGCLIGLTAE